MSILSAFQQMNIAEANRREGYEGNLGLLANLTQKNDLMNFAPWFRASDNFHHSYLQATKLGKGAFKQVNGAVANMSSQTTKMVEDIFFYEGDSPVDEDLFKGLKGDVAKKVRDSEDAMNLEGFMQDFCYHLIYGTGKNGTIKGLEARRAALEAGKVYSAGGTTANRQSSLYLMEFGETGFNFRYAAGGAPGISTEDRGRHYLPAPDGKGNYWAWVRHVALSGGIEIKTDKALQRLANIEEGKGLDITQFIKMKNNLPNVGRGAMGFVNRTVHSMIEAEIFNKSNMAYSIRDVEGYGPVTMVVGIPIMMMDAIKDTEAIVG